MDEPVDDPAETLFRGGAVFGLSRDHREHSAVAVRGGRIIAVGAAALDAAGPGTRTVDLAGGLLVPGFTDAHIHAVQGGLERLRCDLTAARSRAECLDTVARYARARPDAEWVLGGGWAQALFPGGAPRRATSTRSSPTGRCSCRTARTTAPGPTPARWR